MITSKVIKSSSMKKPFLEFEIKRFVFHLQSSGLSSAVSSSSLFHDYWAACEVI